MDAQGNLYISVGATIRKVSQGVIATIAGSGVSGFSGDGGAALSAEMSNPGDLALDLAGNLYAADLGDNRIRLIANAVITTVAGTGAIGYGARLRLRRRICTRSPGSQTDAAGNLYISTNDCIPKVTNGVITTVAGVGPSGSAGFIGDGGPAVKALLSLPTGVALDAAEDIYLGSSGMASTMPDYEGFRKG